MSQNRVSSQFVRYAFSALLAATLLLASCGMPTSRLSVQEDVRMTPEIAAANSPLIHPPRVKCPLLVAVGGAEPKGWQQMSEDYFQFAKQHGMNATYLVEPDANHYTMSEHLLDDRRPLTQAMIRQLGLS